MHGIYLNQTGWLIYTLSGLQPATKTSLFMFHFKDPNDFATVLPPVPDVKAWVQEFRTNHPCSDAEHVAKYEKQLSSLHAERDLMSMEFQTMHLSNRDINKGNETLKAHLHKLEQENIRLRQQNEQQAQHIQRLEQQLRTQPSTVMTTVPHTTATAAHTNPSSNTIAWNFNVDGGGTSTDNTTDNSTDNSNRGKENHSSNFNATTAAQKREYSETESVDKDAVDKNNANPALDRESSSSPPVESMKDILDKRLPTNLDLIRGDILAEAAGNDQYLYCLNMLQKCTTEEWELRHFLMQMIGGLCEENRAVDCNLVYDARHIIKKQLTDLRSTIVKTACDMLVMFSRYCDGNKFAQCLTQFIPIHLDGLFITIACIREAHQQCLTRCISITKSFKCIQVLLKILPSKHLAVRVAVIDLLSLLLQNKSNANWDQNFKMDKYADAIGNAIRTYITDSKSDVRKSVKQLFEHFAECFPQKAKQILSVMDMNSQKTLRKCMVNNSKTQRSKNNYSMPKTRRK